MKVLDLFSGIGGFALGLERAGMTTAMFCEIEPFCRRVLAKHWPGVPIHDDVRTLGARTLAEHGVAVDLVCGGFPCQDISVAGRGAGLSGERSGLWFEYLRVIEETRPRWVVIENVPALRSRGLDVVLGGLAALGYDAEWHCIPASAVGAPHRRDRVWLVANAGSEGRREDLRSAHGHEGADGTQYMLVAGGHGSCGDVAYAHGERQLQPEGRERDQRGWPGDGDSRAPGPLHAGEGTGGRDVGRGGVGADAVAHPEHGGCEGRHAHGRIVEPDAVVPSGWWQSEPDVGRVAHGVPSRVDRLRALGNSVVPQIVEAIGRAIMKAEGRPS